MKILYGVQGTGHGHISRAKVVLPALRKVADVDVLISGYNFKLDLDGEIAYKVRGISLEYDQLGSVDLLETARKLDPVRFIQDMNATPVQDYDFVVNDFEPVSAWAAQKAGIPCVAISHQAAFLSPKVPRPKRRNLFSEGVMKHFAPCTSAIGCHFRRYDDFIEPPIIREAIKQLTPTAGGHVTVYLPAFNYEYLYSIFKNIREVEWHIFSQDCDAPFQKRNVRVNPVGKESFLQSFQDSLGIVCSAGFEAPSEAMYLGKKLLAIPIRNQYEQKCNAAALEELGGNVVYQVDQSFEESLRSWISEGKELQLPEISDEEEIAGKIIAAGNRVRAGVAA